MYQKIYITKKVGKDSLYRDALDVILPKAYQEALTKGNYEPIIESKSGYFTTR